MRKRFILGMVISLLVVGAIYAAWIRAAHPRYTISGCKQIETKARIEPDYSDITIPPNIAPLNFCITETGSAFCARLSSARGETVEVFSRDGAISIPASPWQRLLQDNRGQTLNIAIFVRNAQDQWQQFAPLTNHIAPDEIDGYLVYRRMYPTHLRVRGPMDIYCRHLASFKEDLVLSNQSYESGCVNCHAFPQNRGNKMLLGVRSQKYGIGTLLVANGTVVKLGTKFGYTSWHPSGRMAVYAVNNLPMFYHAARNEVRDTVNLDSLLACYLDDRQQCRVEPKLAQKDRLENWPAWSADGKHLYFCSAPKLWQDLSQTPPRQYDQVKYDLLRIAYDIETNTWGDIEAVLSVQRTGKSMAMPKCSPDGRWLSVCLFDHGYFPAWKAESDIYLIDLQSQDQTGEFAYRRLDLNSDKSESWHSWSSNSRWIVFSSKRQHGIFTRPFISYVDPTGKTHKPFILPQQRADVYDACLRTINTPELTTTPPHPTGEALARVIRGDQEVPLSLPITMATPSAGPDRPASSDWQGQHE